MKKAFILLMSLVAIMTANLNVMAQETATANASMGDDVNRSQYSFITDGNWNDGSHWNTGTVPPSGSDVVIMANAIISTGYTAVVNEVSIVGGSITVADGGQLRHNTENLVVTMKKNLEPYDDVNGTDNYFLLAFPFSDDVAVPSTMTFAEGIDFYIFSQNYPNAEWRNNKQENIATVGGTAGYLYATPEAIELSLTGSTYPSYNEEVKPVTVPYDEGSTNPYNGWALLGNPFTCNAYVYCHNSDNELVPMDFMVYDATGDLVTLSGEPIAPMQGFFVKVTEATTVYIKNYADHSFHEYVDLGLPSGLLWATCNVGANTPEEYGGYFAWGETQPKDYYDWSTYQYCNGSENTLTKYCSFDEYGYNGFTDSLSMLQQGDDAAKVNWGENWRMPVEEEWVELIENTTSEWTSQNGIYGVLFTAENGNTLFLPGAGCRYESNLNGAGESCCYWSSLLSIYNPLRASAAGFENMYSEVFDARRCIGYSIRPVRFSTQSNFPTGTINGKFTINEDGGKIYFSQGNLQYQASTNIWKFAESQYDYIGDANSNISSSYDGWIDLFGWGTSGYHDTNDPYNVNYQPWSSSDSLLDNEYNSYGYGPSSNMPDMNLTGTSANYDWGVNNPISNGGNTANQWRTLTQPEWSYILNTRNTTSGIRFAKAQVNDVNGVILLPDDWTTDTYNLNNTNNIGASYISNVLNASQWVMIENAGGVFLPAAGGRFGTTVADVGSAGFYWLSSSNSSCCAYYVYIYNFGIYLVDYRRYLGRSVRLVCDVES
ncbi:MAG: hypothetical protein IKH44_01345 [Bacteroidales bacterium]|nr:hypothetical protein [Bacteroidales bacterium]